MWLSLRLVYVIPIYLYFCAWCMNEHGWRSTVSLDITRFIFHKLRVWKLKSEELSVFRSRQQQNVYQSCKMCWRTTQPQPQPHLYTPPLGRAVPLPAWPDPPRPPPLLVPGIGVVHSVHLSTAHGTRASKVRLLRLPGPILSDGCVRSASPSKRLMNREHVVEQLTEKRLVPSALSPVCFSPAVWI